jgi:hypothetical protein
MQIFPGARATDALARGRIVDGKVCFLITAPLLAGCGLLRTHSCTYEQREVQNFREETVNFECLTPTKRQLNFELTWQRPKEGQLKGKPAFEVTSQIISTTLGVVPL